MSFRNPFDQLINEFFRAQQGVEQGILRRGETAREDRLIGEERAEQERVRQQQRSFELTDEERERQQQLADQDRAERQTLEAEARAIQDARIKALQDGLQYTEPGSPLWFRTTRAIQEISNPLPGQGMEQRNAAAGATFQFSRPGEVVPGGAVEAGTGLPERKPDVMTEEDVNVLLGELQQRQRNAGITDTSNEALFNTSMAYVSDPTIDDATRLAYANDILGNEHMPDAYKDAVMTAAGIRDKDARQRIKDEGQMRRNDLAIQQQQIRMGNVQIDLALFELEEGKRLSDVNYETAQANLANAIQSGEMVTLTAFRDYGYVPDDEAEAERLARQMGMTVEELRADGERRWEQIRSSDSRAAKLEQLALEQGREDLNLSKIQRQINEYQYERMLGVGLLEDTQNLNANLYAAAANGDRSSIEAIRALADHDERIRDLTMGVDWDGLLAVADEEIEARGDLRAYEKERRAEELQTLRLNKQVSRQRFFEVFAQRFQGTAAQDLPVEVGAFINTLGADEIRSLTGNDNLEAAKTELANKLVAEASYQHWMEEQSDLSASFDMVMQNIPDPNGPGAEIDAWRISFIGIGKALGMDESALESTADALISGANLDYATARAQLEKLRAETDALRAPEPGDMDKWFDNHLDRLQAKAGLYQTMLASQHCNITGIVPEFPGTTGTKYNPDNQRECEGYFNEWRAIHGQIDSLGVAYETGDIHAMMQVLGGSGAPGGPGGPGGSGAPGGGTSGVDMPESGPLNVSQSTAFGAQVLDSLLATNPEVLSDPVAAGQAILDAAAAAGYELEASYRQQLESEFDRPVNPVQDYFNPQATNTPRGAQESAQAAGVPADVYSNRDFLELVARGVTDISSPPGVFGMNVDRAMHISQLIDAFEGQYTQEELEAFLQQARPPAEAE